MANARVAEFRGLDPTAIEAALAALSAEVDAGLAAIAGLHEVIVLVDRDAGRALAITIFDDEASLAAARDVLAPRATSRSRGVRTETTVFDVALRRRAGSQ